MAQLLLFMVFFLPSLLEAADKYTLADLQVLSSEGSYVEFFDHALDVRPSERQDAWKTMVSKMGSEYTKGILARPEVKPAEFKKVQELWAWPALKADEFFRIRRREIAVRYLKNCLKGDDPCWKEVRSFWESDPKDPETAFKLAELVSGQKDSPLPLWTFLDVALKNTLSEFYCKKEFAMTALWGKLEVDYIRLGPQGDLMKKIDDTVHPACISSLMKEARKRLLDPVKTGDRELSYQIINSQAKTDETTSDFFHTVYLLENPSQGELFNYSWNRLKELGNSSRRREAVMEKLKTLDPLPDEILKSFDGAKKRVILMYFKRNFPEYFDHYANQCLKFYGGKSSFPNGNPTMNCQELMSSELGPQIIDQDKIREYQSIRKL